MRNLLNVNFYKLFKSKEFWALLFLYPAITVLTQMTNMFMSEEVQTGIDMFIHGLNNWFVITLAAIIISNFIAEDFLNGAMFYRVAKGYKRSTIYLSYWITSITVMMCFILLEAITGLFVGIASNNLGISTNIFVYQMLISILFSIAYSTLFMMVATISRKSFPAMTINAIIAIVLAALLPYSSDILHNSYISKFWISGYLNSIYTFGQSQINLIIISIVLSIIYILAFYFIGLYIFKKKDIE